MSRALAAGLHVRCLTAAGAGAASTPQIPLHAPLTPKTLLKIQSLLNESVENAYSNPNAHSDKDRDATATVLVPLCNVNGQPGILFQVRGKLRTHSGQVRYTVYICLVYL